LGEDRTCLVEGCAEQGNIADRHGYWCRTHWDEREAARRAEEKRLTEAAGGPWPQTCPRRLSDLGPWERDENLDTWDIREQMHEGLRARHCSFCGSLHPDDFMALVKDGWIVGPTDKSYKAYLGKPRTDEEIAQRKIDFMVGNTAKALVKGTKDHHPDMTDGEVQAELERYWQEMELPLAQSGGQETKFYFQHLSADQRQEFIALYNDKVMRVGYPGHFYSLPFFCRRDAG
jgi:hypothetical protein